MTVRVSGMNYIITFEIEPDRRHSLVEAIKATGEWGEVTPTSFLVASQKPVRYIIEVLQPMLGPKDSLAVLSVSAPWAAHCDPIVEDFAHVLLGQFEDWIPRDWNGKDRS